MLVDLANKLGAPLAKDVDSLRKNLSSAVGKGGYSPAASSPAPSSWRTASPAPAASNGSGDRWANYSRSAPTGGNGAAASGASLSSTELNAFKVGVLTADLPCRSTRGQYLVVVSAICMPICIPFCCE